MPRQVQTIDLGFPTSTSERTISFSWNWPAGPLINAGLRDNPNATLRLDTVVVSRLGSTGILTINLVRGFFVGGDLSRTMELQGSVTISNPTAGTLKYTSTGGSAFDNEPYSYSGGARLATWIADLHGASNKRVTLTFDDNDFKTDILPITADFSVDQPNGQRLSFAEPYPAQNILAFGARDRTRSSGTLWEWNTNIPQLKQPFVNADATDIRRLRLGSDRIFFRDEANNNPGISTVFETRGTLTVWSPTAPDLGEVSFVNPEFSGAGRYNPAADSGWAEFWAGFEGDTANTISFSFDIPGIAVGFAVGRPEAVVDFTKVGVPIPITMDFAVGRPYAYRHSVPISESFSVGRPRGYIPKVAAQSNTLEFAQGRPHGFAHAEFVQANFSVGQPIAQVKRSANPIAFESSVGRPAAEVIGQARVITAQFQASKPVGRTKVTGVPNSITAEFAVGMPDGVKQRVAVASPITLDFAVGRPRGYSESVAANPIGWEWDNEKVVALVKRGVRGIAAEFATGKPYPFARGATLAAEFAVGRPRGYSESVAAAPIAADFSVSRPHGFAHAEFIVAEFAVGQPRVSVKRAVRELSLELATGKPASVRIGFVQSIRVRFRVRRVRAESTKAARPITADFAQGKPIAFIPKTGLPNAIDSLYSTGKPIAFVKRGANPIYVDLSVGTPRAIDYAHIEEILSEWAVGRPRGYLPSVGAVALSFGAQVGMPLGERVRIAQVRGITFEFDVGMPEALVEAIALGNVIGFELSNPESYYPTRNPMRQAAADVAAEAVMLSVRADAVMSNVVVDTVKHRVRVK